jgi:hypothetical protein
MSVAFILDFAEGGAKEYDEVMKQMDLGGRVPPGAQFHVAGAGPSGGWRVVDVWDSDGAFEAFTQSSIIPETQAVQMPAPAVTRFDVHNTRDSGGPRSAITFLQVVRFPGMDAAMFDAMDDEILSPGIPDSLLFHVNGGADGDWVIADGWSSKADRDTFMETQVFPVAAKHPEIARPQIEDLVVHNTLEPRG